MKLLIPDGRRVKLGLVGENAHLFVYRWGLTLRIKDGKDWRHFTARVRCGLYEAPSRGHASFTLETWRTRDGTSERISRSKKYVSLKVLI